MKREAVNTTDTIRRMATVLVTIGALTALAGVAKAAPSKPAGMSKAEYRALILRSEALNQRYGLGRQGAVPTGMTAAEYRALMRRSEALNRRYGPSAGSAPQIASQSTASTQGFAWGTFGIGAAAMLGLVLLVGALLVGSRSARHAPRAGSST
jgi:hypothetical protein